jgi:hypothetical protein
MHKLERIAQGFADRSQWFLSGNDLFGLCERIGICADLPTVQDCARIAMGEKTNWGRQARKTKRPQMNTDKRR